MVVGSGAVEREAVHHLEAECTVQTIEFHRADVAVHADAEIRIERADDAILEIALPERDGARHRRSLIAIAEIVGFGRLGLHTDDLDAVEIVRAWRREALRVARVEHVPVAPRLVREADVGHHIVILLRAGVRQQELRGSLAREGHTARGVRRARRLSRAVGRAVALRVAILIELAREVRRAHAQTVVHLVVHQLAGIAERDLIQLRDRKAIAAAQIGAIGAHDRRAVAAGEHVLRIAERIEEAELPGLAVLGIVERIGQVEQARLRHGPE